MVRLGPPVGGSIYIMDPQIYVVNKHHTLRVPIFAYIIPPQGVPHTLHGDGAEAAPNCGGGSPPKKLGTPQTAATAEAAGQTTAAADAAAGVWKSSGRSRLGGRRTSSFGICWHSDREWLDRRVHQLKHLPSIYVYLPILTW